ncbi:MAG: DUF1858 domain-containing protein [Clostridia bacterium]|nr:DUF1858 domain-containing protein [Clostridia bacterium]
MSTFNKDMTIGEVLEANPEAQIVLMGFGMSCCGCPHSQAETLEEAAAVHGIELEMLLEQLNELEECGCDCGCCHGEECFCGDDCDCGEDCDCDDCCEDDECNCGCEHDSK